MTDSISFNTASLTLDEADMLEQLAGRPVGEIMVGLLRGKFSARDLRAVATVVERRNNPDFVPEDLPGDKKIEGLLVDVAASGVIADAIADA